MASSSGAAERVYGGYTRFELELEVGHPNDFGLDVILYIRWKRSTIDG